MKPLATEDLEHILRHTLPLWEEARGQRFFVSGGTGFFGAWLLESLAFCNRELSLGLSATVLSRDPGAFAQRMPHLASEPAIQLIQGDVRDFAFPKEDFAYVVHAAASTSADAARHPLDLLNTLLGGTERVLAFAKSHGAKKFLFTSSGAVYGRQPQNLTHLPEDYRGGPDWLDPMAAYAEGKRVCEQMCSLSAQASGIEFTIARCFAFVGPHLPLDQHFAIGNFIADALAGRNIRILGDGTPIRSYLYAADLAIWLWTLLFRGAGSESKLEAYNVGSGHAISIRELAREVVQELNPSLQVEIAGNPSKDGPLFQYVPDVQRAEVQLGLRQTIELREAIRRTAAWHR
ncbi:MAG: NAD-dependent epimerase/dehydratase family protein [Terracidiphilus sp.]